MPGDFAVVGTEHLLDLRHRRAFFLRMTSRITLPRRCPTAHLDRKASQQLLKVRRSGERTLASTDEQELAAEVLGARLDDLLHVVGAAPSSLMYCCSSSRTINDSGNFRQH